MFIKKYAKVIVKGTSAILFTSGCMWLCYEVYATRKIINELLPSSALDYHKKKVEYIYLEDTKDILNETDEPFILTSAAIRWWTAIQRSWAHKLLYLAKTGEKFERHRAINSLSQLKVLTDSDFQMLGQMCDAQTAVGLARSEEANLRFFLRPPWFYKTPLSSKELKIKLIELLHSMESQNHHACLDNFLSAYEHGPEDAPGTSYSQISDEEIVVKALNALVHHCSISNNAQDLLKFGAFPLLMELHNYFKDNLEMLSEIFTILSYVSLNPETLNAFYMSGWIGVLAKWNRHSDVRVSLPCAKTLANLDQDFIGFNYPIRVFLLNPVFRNTNPCKADVIFVHGLLGTLFVTWRQRDILKLELPPELSVLPEQSYWQDLFARLKEIGFGKFTGNQSETPITSDRKTKNYMDQLLHLHREDFESLGGDFEYVLADLPKASARKSTGPYSFSGDNDWVRRLTNMEGRSKCWAKDWLPTDCPNVRVLGINYTTMLSQWFPLCPNKQSQLSMAERSLDFLQKLVEVEVGDRPIIWVTHSMGGLLVKQMLVRAYESKNLKFQKVFRNTKAIVFYSCPHMGSEVADLKMPTEMLVWPSVEVQELRYRTAALVDLHLRFLQILKISPMIILSFAETKPTNVTAVQWPINFVQPNSADPGVGEFYEVPLDHINICKPVGRFSFLYSKVVDVINRVLHDR